MLVDNIKFAEKYFCLSERIEKALRFLTCEDFSAVKSKVDYELEGRDIYAWAGEFEQKPIAKGRWEAHENYIDIHYIVEGCQLIGYAHEGEMEKNEAYQPEKDLIFLDGTGDMIRLNAGSFMLVFPQDAHMPDIAPYEGAVVKKVVVKIKV